MDSEFIFNLQTLSSCKALQNNPRIMKSKEQLLHLNEEDLFLESSSGEDQSHFNSNKLQLQILPSSSRTLRICKLQDGTQTVTKNSSTRKSRNKSAAEKYREKKKVYIKELQDSVAILEQKVKTTAGELAAVKKKLTDLNNSDRTRNQHTETYTELENCLVSEEPDIDKINLFLDTLKYRIGGNGKERQAKMDYLFKQAINTIFPALHRYLMYSALAERDLFNQASKNYSQWAKKFFQEKVTLTSQNRQSLLPASQQLSKLKKETQLDIQKLNSLKLLLKQQGQNMQLVSDRLRKILSPFQYAKWTLFCEKHKYRRDTSLDENFETNQEDCLLKLSAPKKKIKL